MYNIYTEYSSSFSGFMSKTNMRHTGLIYVSSKGNVLICVASEFTLISSNNYCILLLHVFRKKYNYAE